MCVRTLVVAGVAALVCSASTPMMRADDVEPRSRLIAGRALAINYSLSLVDYQAVAEEAQKKYGPNSKTVLHGNTGKIVTTLDGKVVATATMKARVQEVFGLLMVGPRRNEMARFPFALSVAGKSERRSEVGKIVRGRFEKQAPQLFDFHDLEWMNLWCWSQDASDAGALFADAQPKLGMADLCLVRCGAGSPGPC
jgi:hypothetical protein